MNGGQHYPVFREQVNQLGPIPDPERSYFTLDLGTYTIKAGFSTEARPRMTILALAGRNKTKDGQVKVGSMISEWEYSKGSVQSPFIEGVIVQVGVLQALVKTIFERLFLGVLNGPEFPYRVAVILSTDTPGISRGYVIDLLENGFNCKQGVQVLETHHIYERTLERCNSILVHLGHTFTTIFHLGTGSRRRIPLGQHHILLYFRQLLRTHYGDVVGSIGLDQFKHVLQEIGAFLSDGKMTQQEAYTDIITRFNTHISNFQRPDVDYPPLTAEYLRQNSHNIYLYLRQFEHLHFLDTHTPYQTLFSQNTNIQMRENAEKYQNQTVQKLLNLIKPEQQFIDHIASVSPEKQQYLAMLGHVLEQLRVEDQKMKCLAHNHAQSILDEVFEMDEFRNSFQVLDIQKLQLYQSQIVDNLQFAFNAVLYQLRSRYKVSNSELPQEITKLNYLPLLYHYENTICNEEGMICVPVFLEAAMSVDLLFNTQQVGLQTQTLDEVINEFISESSGPIGIVLSGGGSTIKNVEHRVRECIRAKQRVHSIINRGGEEHEWEDIGKALE